MFHYPNLGFDHFGLNKKVFKKERKKERKKENDAKLSFSYVSFAKCVVQYTAAALHTALSAAGAFILRQNTNTTEFMEITGNGGENE